MYDKPSVNVFSSITKGAIGMMNVDKLSLDGLCGVFNHNIYMLDATIKGSLRRIGKMHIMAPLLCLGPVAQSGRAADS